MKKLLALVVIMIAAVQFLPSEALIVLSLIPVGVGIGRPVARGVEAYLATR